jgi:rubrerythrin
LESFILHTKIRRSACHEGERMAAMAKDKNLKKILLDIAKEEKTHVGEFLTPILRKDGEQEAEMEEGKKEVEELTDK